MKAECSGRLFQDLSVIIDLLMFRQDKATSLVFTPKDIRLHNLHRFFLSQVIEMVLISSLTTKEFDKISIQKKSCKQYAALF
jgi:molybdopterin-guanine dinucleotide biosynthesis protein